MSSSVPYQGTSAEVGATTTDRAERAMWWLAIAGTASSVVLGVLVVAWPGPTLFVGAALFGVWLLIQGVIHMVAAVVATAEESAARALTAVISVLFIAGVICLRNVVVSLLAIATVIGVTWLIGGITYLVTAFGPRYRGPARALVGLLGAVTILGGLVVLLWPGPSLAVLTYLTGISLIVIGLTQLVVVVRTRPSATSWPPSQRRRP